MRAQLQARRLTAQLNTKSTVVDVIKHLRLLIYLCHFLVTFSIGIWLLRTGKIGGLIDFFFLSEK